LRFILVHKVMEGQMCVRNFVEFRKKIREFTKKNQRVYKIKLER